MILRFALLFCPREFRREYADQVTADAAATGSAWAIASDVARAGIGMRVETLVREFTRAAKSLARAPLFSSIVILTLALAISVNAAVFGMFDAVVHQSIPISGAERIVLLCRPMCNTSMPDPDVAAIARENRTFEKVGVYDMVDQTLTGLGRARRIQVGLASPNVFRLLRIVPELGTFIPGDLSSDSHDVVVSHRFWRSVLSADANVLGRWIVLDGIPRRIIGVAPDDAAFPTPYLPPTPNLFDAWEALPASVYDRGPTAGTDYAFARLRPGATVQSANADVMRISERSSALHPAASPQWPTSVMGLRAWYSSAADRTLSLAFAAVFAILLIACANVANLMLARTIARRHEFAIRAALGAWRMRVVGELSAEIILLTSVAFVVGLGIAWFELRAAGPLGIRFSGVQPSIGWLAILLTLGAVAIAIVIGGIVPAYFSTGKNIESAVRGGGRGGSVARLSTFRASLAVAEIALAFAVVVTSALLFKSFLANAYPNIGARTDGVYSTDVPLFDDRYRSDGSRVAFVDALAERIATIRGIGASTIAVGTPLSPLHDESFAFRMPGRPYRSGKSEDGSLVEIMPNYFATLDIPLISGRRFDVADRAGAPPVAIVAENLSRKYFKGYAVGRRLLLREPDATYRIATIVGVVGDVHSWAASPSEPSVYVPYPQRPSHVAQIVIRLDRPDKDLDRQVGDALASVDPRMAISEMFAWRWLLDGTAYAEHTSAILLAALAIVALLLAIAGTYAIVAYGVEQRWQEFGVRMALGATSRAILADVIWRSARLAVVGIGLGVILAAAAAYHIRTQLSPISPFDPLVFGSVAAGVALTLLLSSWIPARRATRLDPSSALRYE